MLAARRPCSSLLRCTRFHVQRLSAHTLLKFRGRDCFGPKLREMGIAELNSLQLEAIAAAIAGKDVLVKAQTGSGKTMTFLLPMLQSFAETKSDEGPEALVIVPTCELAIQHTIVAHELAAAMHDIPSIGRLQENNAEREWPRLLVATAAQLINFVEAGRNIITDNLKIVAIDEVDAVLCGGAHEQKKTRQAEELLDILKQAGNPQYLMATAYLQQAHEATILSTFPAAVYVQQRGVVGSRASAVLVPTMRQVFHYVSSPAAKDAKLVSVLQRAERDAHTRAGSTLVFCADLAEADRLRRLLAIALPHMQPRALHAGMSDAAQERTLLAFREGGAGSAGGGAGGGGGGGKGEGVGEKEACAPRLLVCTGAVARGLDFPHLRHVVMYDMLDGEVADYVHCAGRTARSGQEGLVTCLLPSRGATGKFKHLHSLQHAPKIDWKPAS